MEAQTSGTIYALITGASAGIGRELARVHAARGGNCVLVARRGDALRALKHELETEHHVRAHVIEADLAHTDAAERIVEELHREDIAIDILINNAAFGSYGPFHTADIDRNTDMIAVNITALVQLTRLVLPQMVMRGRGRILNIASTAAFLPGPTMSVYYASKAFVLHFSEAIADDLRNTGVTVTALCPGPTESEFADVANVRKSAAFQRLPVPSSRDVAEYGYRAMVRGKRVAIHGVFNALTARMVAFVPRGLVLRVVRMIQQSA
jgi:hypothetical protein